MKKSIVTGLLFSIITTSLAIAQGVENDDMYFNSKDREKLKASEADGALSAYSTPAPKKKKDQEIIAEPEESINPTDSYSARNINPEFIARANSSEASEAEQSYYIEGYTPAAANSFDSYSATNYSNSNPYNNAYGNSYNNYYSPYNTWNNPYYGYGAGSWYNNQYGMTPYSAGSGWSLSLSYFFGSPWSSGWNAGLSYGWGSCYNPYSFYSPYAYGYGGYPVYYGSTSVEGSRNYAKRPSRHSAIVTPIQRTTTSVTSTSGTSGSRMRQSTDEYYVKPSRRTSAWSDTSPFNSIRQSTSDYSRTRSSGASGSSFTSPSRSSNSFSSPSRSSYSSPSRSGGGSVSPSRSRGRD